MLAIIMYQLHSRIQDQTQHPNSINIITLSLANLCLLWPDLIHSIFVSTTCLLNNDDHAHDGDQQGKCFPDDRTMKAQEWRKIVTIMNHLKVLDWKLMLIPMLIIVAIAMKTRKMIQYQRWTRRWWGWTGPNKSLIICAWDYFNSVLIYYIPIFDQVTFI